MIGRFTTIDRFAEKYFDYTPYSYGANNPIRNIDINGDTVWVNNGKNNIEYRNGKLYNGDGSQYANKKDTKFDKNGNVSGYRGFLGKAVNALSAVGNTAAGGKQLGTLQASANNFVVKDAKFNPNSLGANSFIPSNNRGAYSEEIKEEGGAYAQSGGSGGTIYFNPDDPDQGSVMEMGGQLGFRPISNLGHELDHALDANSGLLSDKSIMGLNVSEWRASFYENTLRHQLNYPYRETYDTKLGPIRLLDVTNWTPH